MFVIIYEIPVVIMKQLKLNLTKNKRDINSLAFYFVKKVFDWWFKS